MFKIIISSLFLASSVSCQDDEETLHGMFYSVEDSLDQSRNFLAGFQVGFYHDPKIVLSD